MIIEVSFGPLEQDFSIDPLLLEDGGILFLELHHDEDGHKVATVRQCAFLHGHHDEDGHKVGQGEEGGQRQE